MASGPGRDGGAAEDDFGDLEAGRTDREPPEKPLAPEPKPGGKTQSAALKGQLDRAVDSIKSSAPLKARGGNPLYAVPWIMVHGTPSADLPALLQQSWSQVTPAPPPRDAAGPEWWYWWLLEGMVAIECAPGFITGGKPRSLTPSADAGFDLLYKTRELLPLNGLIAAIDVRDLTQPQGGLSDWCTGLRTMIDGGYQATRTRFPVFVMITGLQQVLGHDSYFGELPDDAKVQAIGYRTPTNADGGAPKPMSEAFRDLVSRLRHMRLSILAKRDVLPDTRGVFEFPEQVQALEPGIKVVEETLLSESSWSDKPFWRGLYMAAPGASKAHMQDLFTRFVPADGNLAN